MTKGFKWDMNVIKLVNSPFFVLLRFVPRVTNNGIQSIETYRMMCHLTCHFKQWLPQKVFKDTFCGNIQDLLVENINESNNLHYAKYFM